MTFRNEIKTLRNIQEMSFEEEMIKNFNISRDDIEIYYKIKNWHLGRYYHREFSSDVDSYKEKIDIFTDFLEKYKEKLPSVEIATLKEKIWNLDKSKHKLAEEAFKEYVILASNYTLDKDPAKYINISINYLYRALEFCRKTKKDDLKNEITKLINMMLECSDADDQCLALLVSMSIKTCIHDQLINFEKVVKHLTALEITDDNEDLFRNRLYPSLSEIGSIAPQQIANKLLKYAETTEITNICRSLDLYRQLKKYVLEKALPTSANIDYKINKLNESCHQDILNNGSPLTYSTTTTKIEPIDFSTLTLKEVIEDFLDYPLLSKPIAEKAAKNSIIFNIATIDSIDSEGRKRADNKNAENTAIFRSPDVIIDLSDRMVHIETFLFSMKKDVEITQESIRDYFRLLFSEDFYLSLADGLFYLIQRDFHIALPVLITRFETILKLALNSINKSISITQSNKLDEPLGIGTLITKAHQEKLINDEDLFEIECLLCDDESAGFIVRHEIAHGSLSDSEMESAYRINAAWLVLKLAFKLCSTKV